MECNNQLKLFSFLMIWLLNLATSKPSSKIVENLDGSFFLTKKLRETYKHLIISDRSEDRYMDYWVDGHNGQLSPNVTSTCPWAYRQVWNPTRIPDTFIEAVCLCAKCLNVTSEQPSFEALEKKDYIEETKCSKVEYARWVKVKRHRQGKITYRRRLLMINVGCTCNIEIDKIVTK